MTCMVYEATDGGPVEDCRFELALSAVLTYECRHDWLDTNTVLMCKRTSGLKRPATVLFKCRGLRFVLSIRNNSPKMLHYSICLGFHAF